MQTGIVYRCQYILTGWMPLQMPQLEYDSMMFILPEQKVFCLHQMCFFFFLCV
jgi:hypothetical protein